MATKCDRDRVDNVWIEGAVDEEGRGGICMLDTLSESSVVDILQRDERARTDLKRVTSDERLLELANTVPAFDTEEAGDKLQREINRHADSIPFYALFRGNAPYAHKPE